MKWKGVGQSTPNSFQIFIPFTSSLLFLAEREEQQKKERCLCFLLKFEVQSRGCILLIFNLLIGKGVRRWGAVGTWDDWWDKAWLVARPRRAPGTAWPGSLRLGIPHQSILGTFLISKWLVHQESTSQQARAPSGWAQGCPEAFWSGTGVASGWPGHWNLCPCSSWALCLLPAPNTESFKQGTGNSTAHPHTQSIWLSWILLWMEKFALMLNSGMAIKINANSSSLIPSPVKLHFRGKEAEGNFIQVNQGVTPCLLGLQSDLPACFSGNLSTRCTWRKQAKHQSLFSICKWYKNMQALIWVLWKLLHKNVERKLLL